VPFYGSGTDISRNVRFFLFYKKKKKGGKIFVWERFTLPGSWNEEIFFCFDSFFFFLYLVSFE